MGKAGLLAVLITGFIAAPLAAQTVPPPDGTEPGHAPADLPAAPAAANAGAVTFSLSGGFATDYRFRSISQTDRDPFVYGLVSAQWRDLYVRVGGENVDFNNGTKAEYDVYAGWAPRIGDTSFDLGVVRYGYVDGPRHPGKDTLEYKAGITQTIGRGTIGAQAYYAPDFLTLNSRALYTEVNGSYALTPRIRASGTFGIEQIRHFQDFKAWNLGATYAITRAVGLDLRYYDTDSHQDGRDYHAAFVAGLKLSI